MKLCSICKLKMNKTTTNESHKRNMMRQKLAEFSGYTTLHGVNRMTSNKRVIGKVLWCIVILVCLGFCIRQIYMLCDQYARKTVITIISIRQQTVSFPDISLCNLNPVSFYRISRRTKQGDGYDVVVSSFRQNLYNLSHIAALGTLYKLSETEVNKTTIGISTEIPFNISSNSTSCSKKSKSLTLFTAETLTALLVPQVDTVASGVLVILVFQLMGSRVRMVRQAMNLNHFYSLNFTLQQLKNLNHDISDFVISCIFESQPCKPSSLIPFFDAHYGLCYRFSSESKISKRSGPLFALQLVIDVNQSDYLPNIIPDAGIRLSIHKPGTKPFLQNNGMSIATGLQTDISLVKKTVERFPDRTLCDESNQYNSIVECFDQCRLENVKRMCNCSFGLEADHIPNKGPRTCWFYEYACIDKAFADLTSCNCLSPCRETRYEKTVTTSRWPARNFEPILEEYYRLRGLSYSDYKDSLLAVNIYLESLSEEVIKEEPAFTEENLMSNIGGSLGLWIGMSVISIGEILELVWLLLSIALRRRRKNTIDAQSNDTTFAQSDITTVAQPNNTAAAKSNNTAVV